VALDGFASAVILNGIVGVAWRGCKRWAPGWMRSGLN